MTGADAAGPELARLMSHVEAATYLNIPPETLHQWNYRGVGPRSYKIGKHRKYRLAELDAFIETRASSPVRTP